MYSDAFENSLQRLIYNAVAIANLADNAASAPLTNIAVALHTADPGEAGNMSTNEASYTGYARVNVARSVGGWTVTGNSVSPAANIDFGQRTDTGAAVVATHWSTGFTGGGAAQIINRGVIGSVVGPFSAATTGTFSAPAHGLVVNDRVCFYPTDGSSLPGGVTAGAVLWVITAPTADTFTVSATQGGAAVVISASGDGIAYRVSPITINLNSVPRLTTATAITVD